MGGGSDLPERQDPCFPKDSLGCPLLCAPAVAILHGAVVGGVVVPQVVVGRRLNWPRHVAEQIHLRELLELLRELILHLVRDHRAQRLRAELARGGLHNRQKWQRWEATCR